MNNCHVGIVGGSCEQREQYAHDCWLSFCDEVGPYSNSVKGKMFIYRGSEKDELLAAQMNSVLDMDMNSCGVGLLFSVSTLYDVDGGEKGGGLTFDILFGIKDIDVEIEAIIKKDESINYIVAGPSTAAQIIKEYMFSNN